MIILSILKTHFVHAHMVTLSRSFLSIGMSITWCIIITINMPITTICYIFTLITISIGCRSAICTNCASITCPLFIFAFIHVKHA